MNFKSILSNVMPINFLKVLGTQPITKINGYGQFISACMLVPLLPCAARTLTLTSSWVRLGFNAWVTRYNRLHQAKCDIYTCYVSLFLQTRFSEISKGFAFIHCSCSLVSSNMAIPVIDMGNINGEDRENIMAQIANACESPGFFQLLNHGISHSLMDRVKQLCKEDYKLNREESFNESPMVKRLNKLILDEQQGKSLTESQKIRDVDWEDIFMISDLQKTSSWPTEPSDLKETIEEFQQEIYKLAERLLEIISLNLGLEKSYVKEAFAGGEKPFFGTKVSHYPPCSRPDLIDGLRAHTDAGGLILLFQDDEVPGLQVLSEGHWIDVEPLRYSIVIDIGDQLEVVSGGKYKSAWHRILPTKDGNRLSVASFYNPALNSLVYPAPSPAQEEKTQPMVEDQISAIYPKFSFGDYMNVYSQQKYDAKEPRFEAMRELSRQTC